MTVYVLPIFPKIFTNSLNQLTEYFATLLKFIFLTTKNSEFILISINFRNKEILSVNCYVFLIR